MFHDDTFVFLPLFLPLPGEMVTSDLHQCPCFSEKGCLTMPRGIHFLFSEAHPALCRH